MVRQPLGLSILKRQAEKNLTKTNQELQVQGQSEAYQASPPLMTTV